MRLRFTTPYTLLSAIILLLLIGGCKKKDDGPVSLPITGTWQDVNSPVKSYLIFKGDATVSRLAESAIGIHSYAVDAYAADDKTVRFDPHGDGVQHYNYTISHDTLYISNTYDYNVYVKAQGIDESTWVKKPVTLQKISLPSGLWFGPMDWNGYDFVIAGPTGHKIYKINGSTYNIYDSIVVAQTPTGIALIGTDTWVNNPGPDEKLHKVNSITGATISSSGNAPHAPVIMAANGNDIWFVNSQSEMYSYNIAGNSFTQRSNTLGNLLQGSSGSVLRPDMVIKDGYAYIALFNSILKLNLSTNMVEETYLVDNSAGFYVGIAHDGTNFWTMNVAIGSSLNNLILSLNKIQL